MIITIGFEPFGKHITNLSGQIIKRLPRELDGYQLIKRIIPVSWRESIIIYKNLLSKLKINPKLVILIGIHTNKTINLEVCGWNFKFGRDEDKKVKFGPIKILAPPGIRTKANIDKIYVNLEDKTKISISYFPGFYLCNYVYYWALYLSKKEYPVIFIHIPYRGDETEYYRKFKMILRSIIAVNLKGDLYV